MLHVRRLTNLLTALLTGVVARHDRFRPVHATVFVL